MARVLSHLDWLEAEAIQILHEVAAVCERPVLLCSIGNDSGALPHVDTRWKLRQMCALRERAYATRSVRQGRLIDRDPTAPIERKKPEGHF